MESTNWWVYVFLYVPYCAYVVSQTTRILTT